MQHYITSIYVQTFRCAEGTLTFYSVSLLLFSVNVAKEHAAYQLTCRHNFSI